MNGVTHSLVDGKQQTREQANNCQTREGATRRNAGRRQSLGCDIETDQGAC